MLEHRELPLQAAHSSFGYLYPTESDRLAAGGFLENDIGKFALQETPRKLYMLWTIDPITWKELGASSTEFEPWPVGSIY